MKPENSRFRGFWAPAPPTLDAIIRRLETLSLGPQFVAQREVALGRALRTYLSHSGASPLPPLEQESSAEPRRVP